MARVDADRTTYTESRNGVSLTLGLSQPVPYRLFTLADPVRLVMDFKELDFALLPKEFGADAAYLKSVNSGAFKPGWTRMVLELSEPMLVSLVEMQTEGNNDRGVLSVELRKTDDQTFRAKSNPPRDRFWGLKPEEITVTAKERQDGSRPIIVMLDPGHGGIDHGAIYDGYSEKDLVLQFALELKEALVRTGRFRAFMTRQDDVFQSLPGRIAEARTMNADILVSLHADAISEGSASGVTVYTVSQKASDASAELLASQLSRSDLLAGVDLTDQDDALAGVLMDMARLETQERSDLLAEMTVVGIAQSVGQLRSRPHLSADFAVLKAPDIPSILIELGFMTNRRDLQNLVTKAWREKVIDGIVLAFDTWAVEDAAQAKLLRK